MFDALIWTHEMFILYISSRHPNASSWCLCCRPRLRHGADPCSSWDTRTGWWWNWSWKRSHASASSQTWRLEDDGPTRSWVQRLDRRLIKDSAFRGCRLFFEATQCDLQLRVAPPRKVRRAPHLHQPKRPRFATERACAHVQLYIRRSVASGQKNQGDWAWSCRTCIASQAFWPWSVSLASFM